MNSRTFRLYLMLLCFALLLTACGNKEALTEGKDEAATQAADTTQYSIVRENHLDADGNIINIIDVTVQSTPNNTENELPRKAATMASKEETP